MFKRIILSLSLATITYNAQAETVGESLSALSFETIPNNFSYAPNGENQLITIYPAKPSSSKNGEFNQRAQEKGICPLSITDIKNKAWYAPVAVVESEMKKEANSEKNTLGCIVSGDYDGKAIEQWNLKNEAVTMVVDGNGKIIFLAYGLLDDEQEQKVFALFS
ncbi:MAG: hypothetical protein HRU20_01590 [Pseudomonadales bacterium]|nr:hypothetical protein [Pseudomonadales bacterium]